MKFLKGLALFILGFLLSLSIFIFGIAFLLNQTILNPDFVVSEIDKFDVSQLAEELISQEMPEGELSEEFKISLTDTIAKVEPIVKEQVGAATNYVYDYLLGKSQNLDLALTLRNTVFNSDFITSLLNEIDISSLAEESDISSLAEDFLNQQPAGEFPEETEYLVKYADDVFIELGPWIKEQIGIVTDPLSDYLLGESQSLNVVISLAPVKESVGALKEVFIESPPAELAGLTTAELEQYYDEHFGELAEKVPSTFELDETFIGTDMPTQITDALAKAEEALAQPRQYIGYFHLAYGSLIGLILLAL